MRQDGERERIDGWKAIAWMLRRNERTVMRWEMTRSLPVYRVPGEGKSSVFAYRGELNAWMAGVGAARTTVDAPALVEPTPAAAGGNRTGRAMIWLSGSVLALGAAAAVALSARNQARTPTVARALTPAVAQVDADTLALYLSGRYYWNIRTPVAIGKAVTAYGAVVARDPRYAPAYAGLADCYLLLREYSMLPDAEAFPKAEAAAEAALALDPTLVSGARARAFVRYWWRRDRVGGLAAFGAAIALAPADAQTHHWYATALAAAADHDAALAEIDTARRLDPDSPSILADRGLILFQAGKLDEAKAALEGVVADNPRQMSAHAWLAEVLLARGDSVGFLREKLIAARLRRDAVTEALFLPGAAELARDGRQAMLTALAGRAERAFAGGHNYATDSFTLGSDSTVSGIQFVAWNYAPTDTTASVDWAILSGVRQPYMASPVMASGTSLVTNAFLFNNTQGYGVYSDSFAIPALALLTGTYSLSLANAVASVAGDQVYWDTNAGPSTAVIHTNFGPFESVQPSQSFQVLGSTAGTAPAVPEPATWALMLLGFGCVGGVMRSSRQRAATAQS